MEGISKLAESIWLMLTGGSVDSEPTPEEVQYQVDICSAYVASIDWRNNYQLENQSGVNDCFTVPFLNVALINDGLYAKKATMPAKPINLPRDRGMIAVTYNDPEQKLLIMKQTEILNMPSSGTFRNYGSDLYGVWTGDVFKVYDRCQKRRPRITNLNFYLAIANDATLPDSLAQLVTMEVIKILGAKVRRPDYVDDANNTQ